MMKKQKKVVFVSVYMTKHQEALSSELNKVSDYTFISLFDPGESDGIYQKQVGSLYPYELRAYEGNNHIVAQEKCKESDLLIVGGDTKCDKYALLENREKRVVFHYSERIFKNGFSSHKVILRYFKYALKRHQYQFTYLLAASAFAAKDYAITGNFKDRAFKWGYFPVNYKYDTSQLLSQKIPNKILWVGRLIGLKHPEIALQLGERLLRDNVDFSLDIVGDGEVFPLLHKKISETPGLKERVTLVGSLTPNAVREKMKEASIFLFTSDSNEGWGAVLNESMNAGCAVIANDRIGSVPYLIRNGENGIAIHNNDLDEYYQNLIMLLNNKKRREQIAVNAYETIDKVWNAETAAKRLIILSEAIKNGKDTPFDDGPCSKAIQKL